MIDHSSARRFSTGVPVSAIRRGALILRTACACRAALFLMFWASSRTRRPQSIAESASMSRATSPYVVMTRLTAVVAVARSSPSSRSLP